MNDIAKSIIEVGGAVMVASRVIIKVLPTPKPGSYLETVVEFLEHLALYLKPRIKPLVQVLSAAPDGTVTLLHSSDGMTAKLTSSSVLAPGTALKVAADTTSAAAPLPPIAAPLAAKVVTFVLLFSLIGVMFASSGCGTTTSTSTTFSTNLTTFAVTTNTVTVTNKTFLGVAVTPTNVYITTYTLAKAGATEGMRADTNAQAYIAAVVQVLNAQTSSPNFSLSSLQAAFSDISVSSLRDPTTAARVSNLINELSVFAPAVDIQAQSASPYLMPAIYGIRDGLSAALPLPPG